MNLGNPSTMYDRASDADMRAQLAAADAKNVKIGAFATLLNYRDSRAGGGTRSVADKLGDIVSVADFNNGSPVGTGTADDAPAIRAAMAAVSASGGGGIWFPNPAAYYKCGSSLGSIPGNVRLLGTNKAVCKVRRAFNGGYLFTALDGASADNIWFDGDGASYTGGLCNIPVGHGNQNFTDCKFINAAGGIPIHIACTGATDADVGGSRSNWSNIEAWRSDSTAGSGRYALVHDDPGVPAAGHPISISHLETAGFESIDFGAANDFLLVSCVLFDIKWSNNTRGVHGVAGRNAGATAYSMKGTGDWFGASWGPQVTFEAGGAFHIVCTFNNGYVDNVGASGSLNLTDYTIQTYTPVVYGGGVAWTIGNGSARIDWTRTNRDIKADISIVIGTTTTLPAGLFTLSLPSTTNSGIVAQSLCSGSMNTGGNTYLLGGKIDSGTAILKPLASTGLLSNVSPAAIGGGTAAVINISVIYTV